MTLLSYDKPNWHLADRILAYLTSEYGMRKPPEAASRMLALICELHEHNHPFPTRAEAARPCDCTIFTIDAALSVALARGLIKVEMRTIPGNVQQRASAIKTKHYLPEKPLEQITAAHRTCPSDLR